MEKNKYREQKDRGLFYAHVDRWTMAYLYNLLIHINKALSLSRSLSLSLSLSLSHTHTHTHTHTQNQDLLPDQLNLGTSEESQPWDFFGGNDAEAETPVLWPPHAKS